MNFLSRFSGVAYLLTALVGVGLVSCSDDTGNITSPSSSPAAIAATGGNQQTGTAGQPLGEPVVVQVQDANGGPVQGALVQFVVQSGGGSVQPGQDRTDAQGRASATWTLGEASGQQQLQATVEGTSISTTFTAQVAAGQAEEMQKEDGDDQIAVKGEQFSSPLVVRIVDQFGNPVPGIEVTWETEEESGAVVPVTSTSDSSGLAQTNRRAGDIVGEVETIARAEGLGRVIFTATVVEESDLAPASVAVHGGNHQDAEVGSAPPTPYSVIVKNEDGFPVEGAVVHWSIGAGGGRIKPENSQTNSDGVATTSRQYGTEAGRQTTIAKVSGLTGDSAVIEGVALPGSPEILEPVAGEELAGVLGEVLDPAPEVVVRDQHGNPVSDIDVTWTVLSGGGSVENEEVATDTSGRSRPVWMLGQKAGEQEIQASSEGLSGSPVSFVALAVLPEDATIRKVEGDGQNGTAGQPLAEPYVVEVQLADGTLVDNASVAWRVDSGGGSVLEDTTRTDSTGRASNTAVLPDSVGATQTVLAEAVGANASVSFSSTATESPEATQIEKVSGDEQRGTVEEPVANPLVVRALNASGTPIQGAVVSFEVVSGGGSVDPTTAETNEQGEAQTTRTLGPVVGTHETRAFVNGDTVLFQTQAEGPNGAAELQKIGGDNQEGAAGTTLDDPFDVRVVDGAGVPVEGVEVNWMKLSSGGGAIQEAATQTDTQGETSNMGVLPTSIGDTLRVGATMTALPDTLVFTAVATNSTAPATITVLSGNDQSGEPQQQLPDSLMVAVADSNGAVVEGADVEWEVTSAPDPQSPGALSTARNQTNENGNAGVWYRLGSEPGTYEVTATVPGVQDSAIFTLRAEQPAPQDTTITKVSGDNQTGSPGDTLPEPYRVQVLREDGTPVSGLEVAWSVQSGGGALLQDTTTTDSFGETENTAVLPDTTNTTQTVLVEVAGEGSTVTFSSSTGESDTASGLTIVSGNNQTGVVEEELGNPLVVEATNASGTPIEGASVTFEAFSGDGAVSPSSTTTDINGRAQTTWTLGSNTGTQQARAFLANGDTVIFSATADAPGGAQQLQTVSGNMQEQEAGTEIDDPWVVRVVDEAGADVAGVDVNWRRTSNMGGSINASTTTTDGNGEASNKGVVPNTVGDSLIVEATVPGVADTIEFIAIATNSTIPGNIDIMAGDSTKAPIDTRIDNPELTVTVSDSSGAVIEDEEVQWKIISSPDSSDPGQIEADRNLTDQDGQASVWLQLGSTPGTYKVEAKVEFVDAVVFHAFAFGGADTLKTVSGNAQSAPPGDELSDPLVVRVEDSGGVGVPNVDVTFEAVSGDGGGVSTTSGGPYQNSVTITTNEDGEAEVFREVGGTASSGDDVNTEARLPNVSGVNDVLFTGSAQ